MSGQLPAQTCKSLRQANASTWIHNIFTPPYMLKILTLVIPKYGITHIHKLIRSVSLSRILPLCLRLLLECPLRHTHGKFRLKTANDGPVVSTFHIPLADSSIMCNGHVVYGSDSPIQTVVRPHILGTFSANGNTFFWLLSNGVRPPAETCKTIVHFKLYQPPPTC